MVAKKEKTPERYLQNISNYGDTLATEIRKYVESQVDNWRKIPYLACMADGKMGWVPIERILNGYYLIHTYDTLCVDVENGKLVFVPYNCEKIIDVSNAQVTSLYTKLDKLKTEPIIEYYTTIINSEIPSHNRNNIEQIERIKNRRIEEYKLTPVFSRKVSDGS